MTTTRNALKWCLLSIFSLMIIFPIAASGGETEYRSESGDEAIDGQSLNPLANWYSIQVSALPERAQAESEVSRLREMGTDPFYQYEDTGSKGMWYRVYVGRFPTQEEAQQAAEMLVEQGSVKSYLLRKMLAEKNIAYAVDPQETVSIAADHKRQVKGPAATHQGAGARRVTGVEREAVGGAHGHQAAALGLAHIVGNRLARHGAFLRGEQGVAVSRRASATQCRWGAARGRRLRGWAGWR